jgi:hypothetical protein
MSVGGAERMLLFVCSDLVYVLGSLENFKDKEGRYRTTVRAGECTNAVLFENLRHLFFSFRNTAQTGEISQERR